MPAVAQIVAALGIPVTLVCVVLLATRLRRPELARTGACPAAVNAGRRRFAGLARNPQAAHKGSTGRRRWVGS
jgi:hypothetical protein